jgi:hypothetical protein
MRMYQLSGLALGAYYNELPPTRRRMDTATLCRLCGAQPAQPNPTSAVYNVRGARLLETTRWELSPSKLWLSIQSSRGLHLPPKGTPAGPAWPWLSALPRALFFCSCIGACERAAHIPALCCIWATSFKGILATRPVVRKPPVVAPNLIRWVPHSPTSTCVRANLRTCSLFARRAPFLPATPQKRAPAVHARPPGSAWLLSSMPARGRLRPIR